MSAGNDNHIFTLTFTHTDYRERSRTKTGVLKIKTIFFLSKRRRKTENAVLSLSVLKGQGKQNRKASKTKNLVYSLDRTTNKKQVNQNNLKFQFYTYQITSQDQFE